ncbi:hypothetical protein [Sphingomonas alpina]|uniref:Amidase n=1 Tax=Sphingomonas alpina TaxID=653931 RepID=A0A7H0LIJ7_9SPHN|nr:hypothetical protein [Sphingomonas alpina]QNQ09500.1 hypothetical protein H3Z74_23165 [Sphingomonas alpina]
MKARHIMFWTIPVLLVALSAGAWLYARAMTPQLELGTAYAARVACACRYIGNRDLKNCRSDFEPGMAAIQLSEEPATRTVTAWVPLVASRSARFDPVLGCQPEPFKGTPLKLR